MNLSNVFQACRWKLLALLEATARVNGTGFSEWHMRVRVVVVGFVGVCLSDGHEK